MDGRQEAIFRLEFRAQVILEGKPTPKTISDEDRLTLRRWAWFRALLPPPVARWPWESRLLTRMANLRRRSRRPPNPSVVQTPLARVLRRASAYGVREASDAASWSPGKRERSWPADALASPAPDGRDPRHDAAAHRAAATEVIACMGASPASPVSSSSPSPSPPSSPRSSESSQEQEEEEQARMVVCEPDDTAEEATPDAAEPRPPKRPRVTRRTPAAWVPASRLASSGTVPQMLASVSRWRAWLLKPTLRLNAQAPSLHPAAPAAPAAPATPPAPAPMQSLQSWLRQHQPRPLPCASLPAAEPAPACAAPPAAEPPPAAPPDSDNPWAEQEWTLKLETWLETR